MSTERIPTSSDKSLHSADALSLTWVATKHRDSNVTASKQLKYTSKTGKIHLDPHILRRSQRTRVSGCEAKPITPPQSGPVRGSYQCIVDYNNRPFSITWSDSPEYPDFTTFPFLQNADVSSIPQNSNLATIWRSSTLIDYGSHASIRFTKDSQFPILKLAHPDELSIKLLQHEFDILSELKTLKLPVIEFDQQPILDNGVTCGYRMKRLSKLNLSELSSRADDIKQTLDRLHSAGFSHGDFSPSNIMKDERDCIFLIDFSFARQLGTAVPSCFPPWVYADGIFGIDSDLTAFNRYIDLA